MSSPHEPARLDPAGARTDIDARHTPGHAAALELYKAFPPGWAHLRVPTSSRRAALAGIAMYGASRPRALWGQRLAWALVSLLGPRALPGRGQPWRAPLAPALWAELLERWRKDAGEFHTLAVYERTQAERRGLALLLLGRRGPVAFVKLQPCEQSLLGCEAQALRGLAAYGLRALRAPAVIAQAELQGWHYLAMTALPSRLHRPCLRVPIEPLAQEIAAALGALPRAPGTPAHWQPMHGDLTPWNLRRLGRGAPVLLDWEHAAWGPPHADAVLHRAASAALGARLAALPAAEEAIAFWEARIRERASAQPRDAALSAALLRALTAQRCYAGATRS